MPTDFLRRATVLLALACTLSTFNADVRAQGSDGKMNTPSLKFDFGPGKVKDGYRQVLPATLYTKELGYGFEPGAQVTCEDRGGDALRGDFCTAATPFYFSGALPEGNYDVTITFGERAGESVTTVKAELRRLMLEEVRTARGRFETRTFTVNVGTPESSTGGIVKLKDRQKNMEALAVDEKLAQKFNNARPAIVAIEIKRIDKAPALFLLGDSPVCDQPREPY